MTAPEPAAVSGRSRAVTSASSQLSWILSMFNPLFFIPRTTPQLMTPQFHCWFCFLFLTCFVRCTQTLLLSRALIDTVAAEFIAGQCISGLLEDFPEQEKHTLKLLLSYQLIALSISRFVNIMGDRGEDRAAIERARNGEHRDRKVWGHETDQLYLINTPAPPDREHEDREVQEDEA